MSRPIVEYQLPPTVYIYCLVNPITDTPFYVGRTKQYPLEKRLYGHIKKPFNTKLYAQIKAIFNVGMYPEIKLLYKCKGYYEPTRKEIFFIKKLLKNGVALTNKNLINKKVPCK